MITQNAIKKINGRFCDDIDNIALLVERMQELNKVIFDASCQRCDNESNEPDVKANNYYFISNQSRILIMTVILSECIEELDKIQARMGENYTNLMECTDVASETQ